MDVAANAPGADGRTSSNGPHPGKTGTLNNALIHIPVGMSLDNLKMLPTQIMAKRPQQLTGQVDLVGWTLIRIPVGRVSVLAGARSMQETQVRYRAAPNQISIHLLHVDPNFRRQSRTCVAGEVGKIRVLFE